MIDEQQLRAMSPEERLGLMQKLAAMDRMGLPRTREGDRRRAIALAVIVVCCIVLAAWIGVLATTLPRYYRTGSWRGAWVGFDIGLLAAFAATGWASFRRRQVLIICLVVLATLLCCDAWFDVVLNVRTQGFELSLLSALVIELPLAGLAIAGARRLLRLTSQTLARSQGHAGPAPRLRHMRLVGMSEGQPLSDLLADPTDPAASQAGVGSSAGGRRS